MKMIISEYWNKLEEMPEDELARVIHGEYELKSRLAYPDSAGWKSIDDFRKSARKRHNYEGEPEPGVFRFNRGSFYGIHSYQLITFE